MIRPEQVTSTGAREPEFAEHRAAQADERRRQVKANESSEEAQAPE